MASQSKFVVLTPELWVLGESITGARREALERPPTFEAIIAGLVASARIDRCGKRPPNRPRGSLDRRIAIELSFSNNWVDLFHNSASGVRAQCLHSVELGDRALDEARDALRARAIELLDERKMVNALREFARMSLEEQSTKVWIHQGLWVRRARADVRELRIREWENCVPTDSREAKLLRYGSKAPQHPARIDVLGGLFDVQSKAIPGKRLGQRAAQVNRFGFT